MSGVLATTNVREEVAACKEVEDAGDVRIEESIQGIDGIKQIQSPSRKRSAMIELDVTPTRAASWTKSRSKVDAITTFPR